MWAFNPFFVPDAIQGFGNMVHLSFSGHVHEGSRELRYKKAKNVFLDGSIFDVDKCVSCDDKSSLDTLFPGWKSIFTCQNGNGHSSVRTVHSKKCLVITFFTTVYIEKVKLGFYFPSDTQELHYKVEKSLDGMTYVSIHEKSVDKSGIDEFVLKQTAKYLRISGWRSTNGYRRQKYRLNIKQFHVFGRSIIGEEVNNFRKYLLRELGKDDSVVPQKYVVAISPEHDKLSKIPFFPFFLPDFKVREKNDLQVTIPSRRWEIDAEHFYEIIFDKKPAKSSMLPNLYWLFRKMELKERVYLICMRMEMLELADVIELLKEVILIKTEDIKSIVRMKTPVFRHPMMYSLMNVVKKNENEITKNQFIFLSESLLFVVLSRGFQETDIKTLDYFKGVSHFPSTHLEIFTKLHETRSDFNMKLQCEGQYYDAHIEMLLMRSEFFRSQFSFASGIEFENFRRNGVLPLVGEYFDAAVTGLLLEYYYKGGFSCSRFRPLFKLISFAGMEKDELLQNICVSLVKQLSRDKGENLGRFLKESVYLIENEEALGELSKFWKETFSEKKIQKWFEASRKEKMFRRLQREVEILTNTKKKLQMGNREKEGKIQKAQAELRITKKELLIIKREFPESKKKLVSALEKIGSYHDETNDNEVDESEVEKLEKEVKELKMTAAMDRRGSGSSDCVFYGKYACVIVAVIIFILFSRFRGS